MYLLFALLSMLGFGIVATLYKISQKFLDPISLALCSTFFMTLTIFIFWLFHKPKNITPQGIQITLLAGIIAGLSFVSFILAIYLGKISVTSTIRNLSFVITTLLAFLFLSESLSLLKIIGISLATLSVILLSL